MSKVGGITNGSFISFLVAIDEGYDDELKKLTADLSVEAPMDTASVETRNTRNRLYSLLASFMKNRCLGIVKSTASGSGYEALRQLIFQKWKDCTKSIQLEVLQECYPKLTSLHSPLVCHHAKAH